MKDMVSKVSPTRVRQAALWITPLAVYFVFVMLLINAPFGLSTSAAQAVSSGLVWSIIVLIVGNRTEGDFLRLEDHADLYQVSMLMLIQVGPACLVVFPGGLQGRAWTILMLLSVLPGLALAIVGRRALFSSLEWATATRQVR